MTNIDVEKEMELLVLSGLKSSEESSSPANNKTDVGISDFQAGISLAKAIMGAGSFSLPWAFSQMGYIAGPLFLLSLMSLSVYSLQMLVMCSRKSSSYVDVARNAFGDGGARMVYGASLSASIGVCGSYLVFMATTLNSLFPNILQTHFLLFLTPMAIGLSAVRNVQHFAFTSLLGDISVVLGMLVVLIFGINSTFLSENKLSELVAFGSLQTMPLAFGTIAYLFLVHFLSLPIEASMSKPERFPLVAQRSFTICAILSGVFGLIGYFIFGPDTQQIVLLNVEGSQFVTAVKLLLCADLLFTYPVVMRPSIEIVTNSFFGVENGLQHFKTKRRFNNEGNGHLLVCLLLGFIAAMGGVLIPGFAFLSALVGGVSQTFLALVLPPLMLIQKQSTDRQKELNPWLILTAHTKEVCLTSLGMIIVLWTIATTWRQLIHS